MWRSGSTVVKILEPNRKRVVSIATTWCKRPHYVVYSPTHQQVGSIRVKQNTRVRGPTDRDCSKSGIEDEGDTRSCCVLTPTQSILVAVHVLGVKSEAAKSSEIRFHRRRKNSRGRALTRSHLHSFWGQTIVPEICAESFLLFVCFAGIARQTTIFAGVQW